MLRQTSIAHEYLLLFTAKERVDFINRFAGMNVYIPKTRPAGSQHLLEVLSQESLKQLSKEFGGLYILVPMQWQSKKWKKGSTRNCLIKRQRKAGYTIPQLIRTFGLSRRQIYRILADA